MKKVFLMLAFTGIVGSVSASVLTHDDKDKGKKECKKEGKACCKDKSSSEGKACSGEVKTVEKKACCSKGKTAEAKPAETK